MKNLFDKIKMNQAEAEPTGSGAVADKMPMPDKSQTPQSTPEPETPSDQPEVKYDSFGYKEMPKQETPAPEKKPVEAEPTPEPEEEIKPATGYGENAPAPEKKPVEAEPTPEPETPSEEEAAAEKAAEESGKIKEALKDLPEKDAAVISKFAEDNAMTSDQVKAYLELVKTQDTQAQQEADERLKETRAAWTKELKEDSEFGGEHFDANVKNVEEILHKMFPNTKKELTKRGSVMPPWMMKDMLKVHKALNPPNPLVTGETGTRSQPEEKKSDLEIMYPGH